MSQCYGPLCTAMEQIERERLTRIVTKAACLHAYDNARHGENGGVSLNAINGQICPCGIGVYIHTRMHVHSNIWVEEGQAQPPPPPPPCLLRGMFIPSTYTIYPGLLCPPPQKSH